MRVNSLPINRSRLDPVLRPLNAFLSAESAGGIVLITAALLALVWANSPFLESYHAAQHATMSVGVASLRFSMSLQHWVNDGLMVIFFLLAGLEIKRELLMGELASRRKAALPIAAAIGGMLFPALLYSIFNAHGSGARGWGIPMATDIAFAVGVLTLVGKSVPTSIKVFLLAVAIVDDLGAVVVIAVFYTSKISLPALACTGAFLAVLVLLNILRVHRPLPYLLVGIGLWGAMLLSGIHATIAGVLLAFTIPATRQIEELPYVNHVRRLLVDFESDSTIVPDHLTDDQSHALKSMEEASQAVQTPLARVEHALLRPVSFLVIPIFALANAGVGFAGLQSAWTSPISWGVLLGLVMGKPIGILAAIWLSSKLNLADLPEGATRGQLIGVAVLCGIGFTMSLFVTNLAFVGQEGHLSESKAGILAASVIAAATGGAVLLFGSRNKRYPRSANS